MLFGIPSECPFYGAAIIKIPADGKFNVCVGYPYIVCGIDACPSITWNIGFHPGMGGTVIFPENSYAY